MLNEVEMAECDLAKGTLVVLLGGGQGERLYPLTRDRAKPAVPFGGIYRIIDFALSNCLNSGLRRIYVLTQYKSISLDRHLRMTWNCFHEELGEFVVPMPPQQRAGARWYAGTADAIYQNIYTLEQERPERVVVLAGDHIYKMNYLDMLQFHDQRNARITVGCVEVPLKDAARYGILAVDDDMRIVGFQEKPHNPVPMPGKPDRCLASMGIYVFDTPTLVHVVSEDSKRDSHHDFGMDILPRNIERHPVYAYPFKDENRAEENYWRDIGTIDAYWDAHMDLLRIDRVFHLEDSAWPLRTYQEQHAPARFFSEPNGSSGMALNSIVSQGCVVCGSRVERSVLSPMVRVGAGSTIAESILMHNVQVGRDVRLRKVIVDKGVVIPDGGAAGLDPEFDRRRFTVTESGVIVVPKEVPSGKDFWCPS
jgi:glucose-1-phosphate adenylyltransferase